MLELGIEWVIVQKLQGCYIKNFFDPIWKHFDAEQSFYLVSLALKTFVGIC